MKKMNDKGLTIIEIVVTFSMIMFFCIGLLVIVASYRNKVTVSMKKLELDTFKNDLTQNINDDILKYGLVNVITNSDDPNDPYFEYYHQCINLLSAPAQSGGLSNCIALVFNQKDNAGKYKYASLGTSKVLANDKDSVKHKFIYYDGIKYELKDTLPKNKPANRKWADLQTITVDNNQMLDTSNIILEDGTNIDVYRIDIGITHIDYEDDFGIHVVATTDVVPEMSFPEPEPEIPLDIPSCPGCVFTKTPTTTNPWKFAQLSDGRFYGSGETGQSRFLLAKTKPSEDQYVSDWQELGTGVNYFIGMTLDSDGYINNAYACGIVKGYPFCVKGVAPCGNSGSIISSDPTTFSLNKNVFTSATSLLANGVNVACNRNVSYRLCSDYNNISSPEYNAGCSMTDNGPFTFITEKTGYAYAGYSNGQGCTIDFNGLIYCN